MQATQSHFFTEAVFIDNSQCSFIKVFLYVDENLHVEKLIYKNNSICGQIHLSFILLRS